MTNDGREPAALADDLASREGLGADPELAGWIERFRALTVVPSGRVLPQIRRALRRRAELRAPPAGLEFRFWLQIGLAAAIVVSGLLLERRLQPPSAPPTRLGSVPLAAVSDPAAASRPPVPVPVPEARPDWSELPAADAEGLRRLADVFPRSRVAWDELAAEQIFAQVLSADRRLALLRMEFRQRHSPQARRETIVLAGGDPGVEERIQHLAAQVAARAGTRIDAGVAGPAEIAQALRALLAAGSTDRIGPHPEVVTRLGDWLRARVAGSPIGGGERVLVLAALADLAVVTGGDVAALVGSETERLARETLRPTEQGGRPDLLHWSTPAAMLGEVGRLFAISPAFGVHPALAQRARQLVHEHLWERLERRTVERPDIVAAVRYGFADLNDVAALDRQLLLWRPRQLAELGDGYATMHHLAWSLYPVRPGWAEFQLELRGIAALATPPQLTDAAALLLSLTTSFAAPGVSDLLAIAAR